MIAMNWLSHQETVALGWTIVHSLWQGAALALAFALIDRITRRASSAVRYLIALAAFALMPIAVAATFANEMRTSGAAMTLNHREAAAPPYPMNDIAAQSEQNSTLTASPVKRRSAWIVGDLEPALPWLVDLWIIGVSLLALRAMGGWYQLQTLRKRASWTIPADLANQFHRISEQMRLARQVSLRISDEVISPLAMGAWRATVVLPVSAVLRMPASELEAVLAHELAHIRRFDYLCNLFQTAVESVLFFHPAMWWLSRIVRERREVCCDAIAVLVCADPILYAQALLRLEEEKSAQPQLALALKGPHGSLLRRVKLVLGDEAMAESSATGGMRVAAAILVTALLFGPKIADVVAAPIITASQTTFNRAVPALTLTANPQPPAASAGTKPKSVKQETTNLSILPATSFDVSVKVNPTISAKIAMAGEATSVNDLPAAIAHQSSAEGESKGVGTSHSAGNSSSTKGATYIEDMKAAGYPLDLSNDLDTLVALKSLGVTPDYAKSMAATGLGRPSVQDLIAMKALGVSPEYLASLKQSGLGPKDLQDAVALKSLGVTPEYAAAMKQTGFAAPDAQELLALKAQGITPEYAKWLRQQFPQATLEELKRAAVFHMDDKFMAEAKSHGFNTGDLEKLLRLKISGLLEE